MVILQQWDSLGVGHLFQNRLDHVLLPSLPMFKTTAVERKTRRMPQLPLLSPTEGRTGVRSVSDPLVPICCWLLGPWCPGLILAPRWGWQAVLTRGWPCIPSLTDSPHKIPRTQRILAASTLGHRPRGAPGQFTVNSVQLSPFLYLTSLCRKKKTTVLILTILYFPARGAPWPSFFLLWGRLLLWPTRWAWPQDGASTGDSFKRDLGKSNPREAPLCPCLILWRNMVYVSVELGYNVVLKGKHGRLFS